MTEEQTDGVQVPVNAVIQAQQRKIAQLTDENIMQGARLIDLEAQLAEATEKLVSLDRSP